MLLKEYKMLVEGWNKYLNENINISDDEEIKSYVKRLDKIILDFKQKDEEYYNYYAFQTSLIHQKLENFLYHDSILKIGDGESREGYSFKDKPWVIKLAKSASGAKNNKRELDIYQKRHGKDATDIFVRLYYWDEINENPWWIVSEKVKPLSEIEDIEVLKNVFPTFWNMLNNSDNRAKRSANHFREFIVKTISLCINGVRLPEKERKISRKKDEDKYREMIMFNRNTLDDKSVDSVNNILKRSTKNFDNSGKLSKILPKISKEIFYNSANRHAYVKDLEEVEFYEDFKRLSKGFGYINTNDMHDDNFGIRISENPTPSDIVILDFDISI